MTCALTPSVVAVDTRPAVVVPAAVAGSLVGGLAAGWLWTAQSGYFTSCVDAFAAADRTAEAKRTEQPLPLGEDGGRGAPAPQDDPRLAKQRAASALAGIFSTAYLGFEVYRPV